MTQLCYYIVSGQRLLQNLPQNTVLHRQISERGNGVAINDHSLTFVGMKEYLI
ncbi:MAG: hypothetical protein AAFZ15_00635 [Bacteroidota bacterium]